jgi:hypothetical protein
LKQNSQEEFIGFLFLYLHQNTEMKIYLVSYNEEKLLNSWKKFSKLVSEEAKKYDIEIEIVDQSILDLKVDAIVS